MDPSRWHEDHYEALLRFARLRIASQEDAEDIVQECLAAALEAADSFAGDSSERTWLVGILKNKIVDRYRKRELPVVPIEQVELDLFNDHGRWRLPVADWSAEPDRRLEAEEGRRDLLDCIGRLPDGLRQAYVMREVDGFETQDCCDILGISPTNLTTRLYRARLTLRECLDSKWSDGEGTR